MYTCTISSGEHICSRGHLLRAPLPHLQRARKKTSQGDAHTVCARCVHVVRAAGRRARLACLPVCSSHLMSMAAMLHRPADLRATCKQNARHELCAKAGGTATAGTRHAASTLAARLAPRHPRQACRPTLTHTPRLRAPPAEGRAQRGCRSRSASTHRPPTVQLGSPTRRSECSRPISWSAEASGPSHGQPYAHLQTGTPCLWRSQLQPQLGIALRLMTGARAGQ